MTSEKLDTSNYSDSEEDFAPLRCWECNVNFTSKHYLHAHLFHHIRQPTVIIERVILPPLKITLKNRSGNSFEIISPPPSVSPSVSINSSNLAEIKREEAAPEEQQASSSSAEQTTEVREEEEEEEQIRFSPTFAGVEDLGLNQGSPSSDAGTTSSTSTTEKVPDGAATDGLINSNSNSNSNASGSEYAGVPGAEPTPPPEPATDYPKIRIKTTGLLKETSLTITEITDDNPDGDPSFNRNTDNSNLWPTPSLEDPLKLPDGDDNILSLFNNNDRAKDLGFHSSDNEFISLDRLEERNRGTMQLYNPNSQNTSGSPLDNLTGLPMQALAQQVSRLQPNASGMHQQNVLINIQQFPSGPPQPSYQPPPMYSYPQPLHQPYQYQPPNPMYYPPAPGYPPQHMPPPPQPQLGPPMNQPQMGQPPMGGQQPQGAPASQPQAMQQQQQGQPYRQPMPPRQMAPRQQQPNSRMPNGLRPQMGQRQPMARQRAPMMRPRGAAPGAMTRPRQGAPSNGLRPGQQAQPVKRAPDLAQQLQAKKKRFDMLTPDKDDEDCQVICMQPKNTDGGLPQIESVQGGTAESSIMHLSDSITLSVRNPPPKRAESPKKSDAKAVANILATRGITVTATAKSKEKQESPQKNAPALPASLNLNGAVSIIPAAKNNGSPNKSPTGEALPTVDLTDDLASNPQSLSSQQKQRPGLPYRCDLCPAQYPNAVGLNKHRQTYHKTSSGMAELGIPLVNLKAPGILQKLSAMGIQNYIPIPSAGPDGTFCVPIINARNPGNVSSLGATTMLSLGPIRNLPRPQQNSLNTGKTSNVQK